MKQPTMFLLYWPFFNKKKLYISNGFQRFFTDLYNSNIFKFLKKIKIERKKSKF